MLKIAASLLLLHQVPEEKYMRAFQSRLKEKNPGPHVVLYAACFRFNTGGTDSYLPMFAFPFFCMYDEAPLQ